MQRILSAPHQYRRTIRIDPERLRLMDGITRSLFLFVAAHSPIALNQLVADISGAQDNLSSLLKSLVVQVFTKNGDFRLRAGGPDRLSIWKRNGDAKNERVGNDNLKGGQSSQWILGALLLAFFESAGVDLDDFNLTDGPVELGQKRTLLTQVMGPATALGCSEPPWHTRQHAEAR